jgi:hypothetical protein
LGFEPTGAGRTSNAVLHGHAIKPYQFSANSGNEALFDESLTSEEILFNSREATGSVTIESPSLQEIDYFTRASQRNHGNQTIQQGQTPGNICKFEAPRVQIAKPSYTALDNGNIGLEISTKYLPVNGQDEYEFIFE